MDVSGKWCERNGGIPKKIIRRDRSGGLNSGRKNPKILRLNECGKHFARILPKSRGSIALLKKRSSSSTGTNGGYTYTVHLCKSRSQNSFGPFNKRRDSNEKQRTSMPGKTGENL